jgi:uncharacterized repeat protein (TIGR01451 family)
MGVRGAPGFFRGRIRIMSRFFSKKPLLAGAVSALVLIGVWTLAAPQARNPRAKILRDEGIRSLAGRASANARGERKIGLITGYSSPGIFILDPDTNAVSGPILSDQIDSANISCAVVTPDGMTGIVEWGGLALGPSGWLADAMILYFIDLSNPAAPVLLGTAVRYFTGQMTLVKAGHLRLAPDGGFVIATGTDHSHFTGDYFGFLESFQVSARAWISETGPGLEYTRTDIVPYSVVAPDGKTVLVTHIGTTRPQDAACYVMGIDPSSGQLSYGGAFSNPRITAMVVSVSPDGRTVIVGAPGSSLSILRIDSPRNLVFTGSLSPFINSLSSIGFAPGGKKAYVLGDDALHVMNVLSPGVVEDSGLGIPIDATEANDPDSFAIEPQGRYAYVGGPAIRVVDLKTNSVVGSIATGAKSISFPNPILADLGLTKSVDNLYPILGDTISFTVTAANNGPRDATGVRVSDQLPDGLLCVSHTTTGGAYDPATGVWNIGNLGQGNSAVLTVRTRVEKIGSMTNTARLQSINEVDPEPANDAASVTVEADVRPDFSNPQLNYEAVDRLAARPGQTLTSTINYGNSGGRALGVVITNQIDNNLENVQPLDGGVISNGKITWDLGRVAANTSGSVRFKADVGHGVPRGTKIVNQAAIVSDQTSPVVTNTVFVTVL